jgi:hypothetical protein
MGSILSTKNKRILLAVEELGFKGASKTFQPHEF